MLTQEKIQELFDYRDGKLYWKVQASQMKPGNRAGYRGVDGYWRIQIANKLYLEHRLVFLYHHGYLPKQIDHRNRKLENQIDNLRPAVQSQNMMNSTPRNNCSSQYKGVCWDKSRKQWVARIKRKHLGRFRVEIDAALAYNEAAVRFFGEYANLNIVGE